MLCQQLEFFSNCGAELTIEFQRTAYNISEGDGSTTVCFEIDPESSESVTVFVSVASGSASEGRLRLSPLRTILPSVDIFYCYT